MNVFSVEKSALECVDGYKNRYKKLLQKKQLIQTDLKRKQKVETR